jgi:hypothetical protein
VSAIEPIPPRRVEPARRVEGRHRDDERPDEEPQRRPPAEPESEPEDDGLPHVDVLV